MTASAPSELILFVAACVAAAGAGGVLAWTADGMADHVSTRGDAYASRLASAVLIVNDPGHVPTDPLLVYVKNVGATVLDPALLTVIVDGRYVTPDEVRLEARATAWGPGDVVRYRVPEDEAPLPEGDHVVRVVTENGRADTLRFRVVA